MKISTIWTLRGCPLKERLLRTRDSLAMSIAAHLPLRIRYWCTMIELGHATKNSPNVPATSLDEILKNLQAPNGGLYLIQRGGIKYSEVIKETEKDDSKPIKELCDAIRLTVEYVGLDMLPPIPGWSWYDALVKYSPKDAEAALNVWKAVQNDS